MNPGETVYHVANPTVEGIVVYSGYPRKDYIPTVAVIFSEPVNFSLSGSSEKHREWICSHNLLYPSSTKAMANSNPELADPDRYMEFLKEKFESRPRELKWYEKFIHFLHRVWKA